MSTTPERPALETQHLDMLREQRDALRRELDLIAAYHPKTLARYQLYTPGAMVRHAAKVRASERARYTVAEQEAARLRELAAEERERQAFRARRDAEA